VNDTAKKAIEEEVEISMTPMIDVVFLLLIFFMLSSRFGMDTVLPIAGGAAATQAAPLAREGLELTIDEAGRYFLNQQALVNTRPDTLGRALAQAVQSEDASARLLIRADARVAHQAVVTALDVAGQQGFNDIVIETTPAETP